METTKPFLVIDLQKAITRTQARAVHKDLPEGGQWRTMNGHHIYVVGGKIVAGSVPGAKGAKKASKAQLQEHQANFDAEAKKAKAKKTKATAGKAKATKTANKTNATGKTGASKPVEDPTAKKKTAKVPKAPAKTAVKQAKNEPAKKAPAKVTKPTAEDKAVKNLIKKKASEAKKKQSDKLSAYNKKATAERKAIREAKKKHDMEAPVLKRQTRHDEDSPQTVKQKIAQKPHAEDPSKNKINQEVQEAKNLENTPSEQADYIGKMWSDPRVQKLMAKAPEKRSAKEITALAREMVQKDADREIGDHGGRSGKSSLARYVAGKVAQKWGINPSYNKIGNKATSSANTKLQETGLYGDALQSARATMFETLHNVMAGSQNPGKDTNITQHVIRRIKDKLHRDLYGMMNDMPAPHEMRNAIGDVKKHEQILSQKLGRTPEHDELAQHLQEHSSAFRSATVPKPPKWDEKANDWVATKEQAKDPSERLHLLNMYASQQKAGSMDKNIGKDGEKDVSIADGMSDRNASSPEESYEKKERQKELEGALPKAMRDMGLSDAEIQVMRLKHSQASETGSKASLTDPEVAQRFNEAGLHHTHNDGKEVDGKWIANRRSSAEGKIREAVMSNHPAIQQLAMMKSFIFSIILKGLYEMDLVKSLASWGVGIDMLEQRYVRKELARNQVDLRKSLAPHEYVGSYVVTDEGDIIANVVEFALPERNQLYKSFNEYMSGIQKSMFPHVDPQNRNHVVNQKAQDYVKANQGKYKSLQDAQHSRLAGKKSGLTWSEQLQKEKGGVWITWGGKKVLIDADSGNILYDSRNEVHRDVYNSGAQEDKIDFHHEEGMDDEAKKANDHGLQAFQKQMDDMRSDWKDRIKPKLKEENKHRTNHAFSNMSEEQRADVEGAEDKGQAIGNHILANHPEVVDHFKALQDRIHGETAGMKASEAQKKRKELAKEAMETLGKDYKGKSNALVNTDKVTAITHAMKDFDLGSDEGKQQLAKLIGDAEVSRGNEEAHKKLIPEGSFMIGNPQTGKTMVVRFEHGFGGDGGNKGKKGWTAKIAEAFDPDGGQHEDLQTWGGLGRALGLENANNLQEILAQHANTDPDKPFMKEVSSDDFKKLRSNTKLGKQETMLHKQFKLVDEQRDKDGNLASRTYAQKMEDGTTNHLEVDGEGYVKDPLMKRLLNQRKPVHNEKEVNDLLKNAVGNRRWVTAHFGSDIHVGDALGHHIQLEYDGKGAPLVVGGKYDGYRYIDKNDVPKGTTDPATGEPVKALFKNGKLVDRRFTTSNDVDMKAGNPVMYKTESGSYRKGRIHSVEGDNYRVTDGKGHVVGIYKKGDLKPAKAEGRTLSDSGQAVVRASKTGTHRMNVAESFKPEGEGKRHQARADKARDLFTQALQKAKINQGAFDHEGNLNKELELSDQQMKRLQKVLGRSKAGKEMLKKFQSAYVPGLEVHVPESLRSAVEATGVNVLKDGTAKISASKFEELRNALGGLSMDVGARDYLADHFQRKDRAPKTTEELRENYQPSTIKTKNTAFNEQYKAQFKPDSYLMNSSKGLYGTQLDGIAHLVERGRGIAGHGMGTGKTILGVVAGLHTKAQALAKGEKPKKTLIVAPKGIMSDWGKEIGSHTNSKGLYIGSSFNGATTSEDGKKMWGQKGTEQEAIHTKKFLQEMDKHHDSDHDFHIVNYDTFMKHRDKFANSGLYDNIAIDEVHAFKNQKGKRGQSLAETTDKFKNVWGLSGTPMENDAREVYSLIDTITGGRHELGTPKEFQEKFMKKDKNGKLVGVKPEMAEKLGDILANVVQFRGGEDVRYNDGSKIEFPTLAGEQSNDPEKPSPKVDFIGNMVDRSRDHATNNYYGTKHSVTDFDSAPKTVTNAKSGDTYEVQTFTPKNLSPSSQVMYDKYNELQNRFLPESKLNELATASATGYDQGKKGGENYLTAMQKLQKFLNAPLSHRMYVGEGQDAFDSDVTGAQSESAGGKKKAEGLKEGEHYQVDENGFKRYYERDPQTGSYAKNPDGSPKLLPPLHEDNPKAQYLKKRVNQYLDSLHKENLDRMKRGQKPLVPKVVVKSSYTTFGTDIADNVLKEIGQTHPIFKHLANNGHKDLTTGSFTGENDNREQIKGDFRGNKHDYMNNQGNMWATSVSPAGKEGVDFGNAHVMFHYDQDWNPQKMAQFTARVRRSDSAKTHTQAERANAVRVESLHMPGTVEDFMFNSQDAKMKDISQVVDSTRMAEKNPKLGETESKRGRGKRGFTSGYKDKAPGAKPKNPKSPGKVPEAPRPGGVAPLPKTAVASAEKAMKFVILL